ncbi:hypothetical protein SDC9_202255 [bioreactor metagenome]|uniref:Uncharacterized protein n=1 Tax=bioreactor metagenome TaxID=1076179 RepID=A0A645J261_9ZZZZ
MDKEIDGDSGVLLETLQRVLRLVGANFFDLGHVVNHRQFSFKQKPVQIVEIVIDRRIGIAGDLAKSPCGDSTDTFAEDQVFYGFDISGFDGFLFYIGGSFLKFGQS